MIESYLRGKPIPHGPFINELQSFAEHLVSAGYSESTIRAYLNSAASLVHWLHDNRIEMAAVNQIVVEKFLRQRGFSKKQKKAGSVALFLRHLRSHAHDSFDESETSTAEQWCLRYQQYLEQVLGAAKLTTTKYLYFAKKILSLISADNSLSWSLVTPEFVREFVQRDIGTRTGDGPKATTSAVRSFLRFLVAHNLISADVILAVPTLRCWPASGLPQYLESAEIEQVLSACSRGTARGNRSYAILQLLARLGMRAQEVANLRLEDLDWIGRSIKIRASKNYCERHLPLPDAVAKAVLDYLTSGRPATNCRHVFMTAQAPIRGLSASAVSRIVSRNLTASGLSGAAHLFRHTVATRLVNSGASFKTIADLLGHRAARSCARFSLLSAVQLSSY